MRMDTDKLDSTIINEVQLLLAEKRTSLAAIRTGIAVLALPLSIFSVLIATSKFYDVLHVMSLLVPLGIFNLAMLVFGVYLILHALLRLRRYDRLIQKIKQQHSVICEFIE